MLSTRFKITELLIIFIIIPISFLFEYSTIIKLLIAVCGLLYIVYCLLKFDKKYFKIDKNLNWKKFWKTTFIKFLIIATITTLFVWFTNQENLFSILLEKPKLWIFILFFYSVFSVYPQEFVYRTFFFQRYQILFKNKLTFIFINASLFSLAHILFKSSLVLLLTFIGGILFAYTYKESKSTLLVSIEHAIYGSWLFTVGMGNMLGFPS